MKNYEELEKKLFNDMQFTAHDGDIIQVKIDGDKIIIRYGLGECNYLWAEDTFKDYWKDQKNVFILDQIFNGSYLPQNPNTLTHKGWRETTNPKNPKNKEYQRKSTGQTVRYDPPRPRQGTNVIEDEHYHWYTEPSFEKRRKQDTKQKFYDRYGKICADRSDESHLAPLDKKYIKK